MGKRINKDYLHGAGMRIFLTFCTWFILTTASAQVHFQARVRNILHTYDTLTTPHLIRSLRQYQKGFIQSADSLALLTPQLTRPHGDMFWLISIAGYSAWRKPEKNDSIAERIKHWLKHYPVKKGDTENHHLLYYTALYLLPQYYPELIRSDDWFHGQDPLTMKREAYEHIQNWIKRTTFEGQGEFDTPTYFPEYMWCMALLYCFAEEEKLRLQARLMMDWLLIDFALDHLDGMMLGGHSREDPVAVYTPRKGFATEFAYLYFGIGEHQPSLTWCVWINAICGYEPPAFIQRLATDRSRPYLNKERKRTRDRYRHVTRKNDPVYRTTYVTNEYGLSSIQGGILQPIRQHTWSVRFREAQPFSTIFAVHPSWSNYELEMYFEDQPGVEAVAREKPTYTQPTKWTSASPCERIFQYKNDLIGLYVIPDSMPTDHINFFFPKTLDKRKVLPTGWIVARAGKTYIGVYLYQPYEWMQLPEDEYNYRLRSKGMMNGYVVVVRDESEVGSFEIFCEKISASRPAFRWENQSLSVTYYNIDRTELSFKFPEKRAVNGVAYTFEDWKLFESPFTQGNEGSLYVRYGKEAYHYRPTEAITEPLTKKDLKRIFPLTSP